MWYYGPATSFDPDPDPTRVDSSHVGVADVYREGDLYWMWNFSGDQRVQRIGKLEIKGFPMASGCAVSRDGVNWLRLDGPHPDGSIVAQSPRGSGLWDHRLGCPRVVGMTDGSLRLYNIGSTERPREGGSELDTRNFIGLAVGNGTSDAGKDGQTEQHEY